MKRDELRSMAIDLLRSPYLLSVGTQMCRKEEKENWIRTLFPSLNPFFYLHLNCMTVCVCLLYICSGKTMCMYGLGRTGERESNRCLSDGEINQSVKSD